METSEEYNIEADNDEPLASHLRLRKMENSKRSERSSLSEEEEEDIDDEELDEEVLLSTLNAAAGESGEEREPGVAGDFLQSRKDDWKDHWGIKCQGCGQMFANRPIFEAHFKNEHNGPKPLYQCSYCNKIMDHYSTFRSHRYRHITEGRYRCEVCKKGFSVRSLLRIHILSKHAEVKPYICEECGRGFGTRPGLNLHLEKHRSTASSGSKQWPCDLCGKVLLTSSGHKAHMAVHQQGKRFMCELCGKTFTQKVNMQQHFKGHSGEKPFTCPICGKGFAEKSHLNRHNSFHSNERPYRCEVCHKMYKTERCLKVHSMTHAELRPCVCSYCGKGFLSNNKLKQHYNIHTGERPYSCKFCERTFTNYPNYLKHTRRRHKQVMAELGVTPASLAKMQPIQPTETSSEPQELTLVQIPQHSSLELEEAMVSAPGDVDGQVILGSPYIKYEPLDMSPLPQDLQGDAVIKFPDLTPQSLHQVNPYHQYQDQFLC